MGKTYEVLRFRDRPQGAYAVHHLFPGDSLDCAGVTLTLQRERDADTGSEKLVLIAEQGEMRAVVDATRAVSLRSHCGVLILPRAVASIGGVRVELVLEVRAAEVDAVMPRKVAA